MRSCGVAAVIVLGVLAACAAPARHVAEPEPVTTRAAGTVLKDTLTQSAIKAALADDVGALRIRVRVENGIATLSGTARNAKSKAGALAAARETTGVRNVVDRIRVAGP
jgi:osmotically-inducible protein OsmY